MKPVQIGLLVLVGALGGALIMKFTQRPKPAPIPAAAPVASAAPTPAPAPISQPVEPAPAAQPAPETAANEKPAPPRPEPKPEPVRAHRPKPIRQVRPPVVAVAQNLPPAQVQPAVSQPAPDPVRDNPFPAAPAVAPPPISEPAPTPAEPAEPPAPAQAPSVTLTSGMVFTVRLGQSLSSEHNQAGDTFTATLDGPVAADGFVIAERGARVEGKIVDVQKAGHVKGQAVLAIELTRLTTSDGQHVPIETETFRKQSPKASGEDVGIVAAAAGVGAIIGAMAGGGKGAAIGAGAGGAAGAGGVVATRSKAVSLANETKISFRLKEPVTITEQVNR